ncbi:ATP-binding cassette domain-containing protein [Desulfatirhabdium butyrativorans]|uniref:ATP-binding cassette domain-containing protein n=1 Tax=Desulfatirhabdium butyrativorans TaxID=340467 RepID=UPI0003FB2933|nr:ATP-binding cassette domain-containing protein [Desulfatirhabdium butyrativorans]
MPFIVFDNVSTVIRGQTVLKEISWQIEPHQNWVIVGPNGAGKSSLLKIILGRLYYRGHFRMAEGLRKRTRLVSFDRHTHLIRGETERDQSRYFSGRLDEGILTPAALIHSSAGTKGHPDSVRDIVALLDIGNILDREIRQLSTGEMRKVLIAEALMTEPELLILDEPFDGIDRESARLLIRFTDHLIESGIQVILVTHRFEEIPSRLTHALCLQNGRIFRQGPIEILRNKRLITKLYPVHSKAVSFTENTSIPGSTGIGDSFSALIRMKNVCVAHGRTKILDHIDWEVHPGENWLICGPNGAGKSTLIRLITADEPQAYANEIELFGKKRGTGESIWEIKQKIGLISSEFQIRYRGAATPMSAFQVVLSGFFDSVGLYRNASSAQRQIAGQWLQRIGMAQYGERIFAHLSYGEQRMILIARAMVKSPVLLILDEPFEGLDYANRRMLLNLIDDIGINTPTGIIYVTHRKDRLDCITHRFDFVPDKTGGYRIVQRRNRGERDKF